MTNEKISEQTNEPANPKKGSRKKILFLTLGLLLATGGFFGWRFFSHPPAQKPVVRPLTIVPLDNFIVNLADTDRDAYLKVGIDLGVGKPMVKGADGKSVVATAAIRDAILSVLTTCRSSDLLTPKGKKKLKRDLIAVLREKVARLEVRHVYFTHFLVQR